MTKKRMLIAEDNVDLRQIFNLVFQGPDYDIQVVRDGEEALLKLQEELPDIVVLDVNMPKVSGLTVLKYIREQPEGAKVKVIILTGNSLTQQSPEADLADLFLLKPVRISDLKTLAARLMGE